MTLTFQLGLMNLPIVFRSMPLPGLEVNRNAMGDFICGAHMTKLIDLTKRRFGRLTVIKRVGTRQRHPLWLCRCECGKERVLRGQSLRRGETRACRRCQLKCGGMTSKYKDIVGVYYGMIRRCYYRRDNSFKNYGARGIRVCERWLQSIENFAKDMGKRPRGGTIDRVNNDGNYEPNNCVWATRFQQAHNSRHVIHDDLEFVKTVSRQRIWQIRKRRQGCCAMCGKKRDRLLAYCNSCAVKVYNYKSNKKQRYELRRSA